MAPLVHHCSFFFILGNFSRRHFTHVRGRGVGTSVVADFRFVLFFVSSDNHCAIIQNN